MDDQRGKVLRQLGDALEDMLFNLEHGIPWSLIRRLESIAETLGGLAAEDPSLAAEIEAFQAAVGKLSADRGAADPILAHGRQILDRLGDSGRP